MRLVHITGLLTLLLFGAACKNQKTTEVSGTVLENLEKTRSKPEIRFEKKEHNLGKVVQGEKVGYNFIFTNVGDASLVILDASASCGCTVPKYSREPIAPGEKGSVEVVFDSSGRMGQQSKTVTLKTNGKVKIVYLTIKADIIRKEF
jgi:hypothetical protein